MASDDNEALAKLFLELATRAARRQQIPPSWRDDVAQEAALAAHKRRHTYDPALGTYEAWIAGIVRHAARAYRRRPDQRPVPAPSIARPLLHDERTMLRQLCRIALALLPPREREALLLLVLEECTVREIAATQGRSPTGVHTRLTMALEALRAALRKRGIDP